MVAVQNRTRGRSVTSKTASILSAFSSGTREMSLNALARRTGLPVSTTYRLALELVDWGALERAPGGGFRIGLRLWESGLPISTAHRLATELAGWAILERTEDGLYRVGMQLRAIAGGVAATPPSFHERARRQLEDLASATRCVVRLGVFEGIDVAYIEKCALNRPVSLVFEAKQLPPHATAMGKALLAFASPALIDKVIARGLRAYTPLTITSPDRLRRALAVTRLTRVAVSRREHVPDACAVAAPVFGTGGGVVAALEVTVTDAAELRQLQPPLVVAARSLTRELQADATGGHLTMSPRRHFDVMFARQPVRATPRRAS